MDRIERCPHGWAYRTKVFPTADSGTVLVQEWTSDECKLCLNDRSRPAHTYTRPRGAGDPEFVQEATESVTQEEQVTVVVNGQEFKGTLPKIPDGEPVVVSAYQHSEGWKGLGTCGELRVATDITHETTKCLDKAKELVCGDRAEDYGDPAETYGELAKAWEGYSKLAIKARGKLDGRDVTNMLGIMKFFRDAVVRKEDNLVDAAGYSQLGNWQGKSLGLPVLGRLSHEIPELTKEAMKAALGEIT